MDIDERLETNLSPGSQKREQLLGTHTAHFHARKVLINERVRNVIRFRCLLMTSTSKFSEHNVVQYVYSIVATAG